MRSKMQCGLVLMTLAAIAAALPRAYAEDMTALETLRNELEHKLPSSWQMHVRWRDGALLASFICRPTRRPSISGIAQGICLRR
jgi:hypothetical protein